MEQEEEVLELLWREARLSSETRRKGLRVALKFYLLSIREFCITAPRQHVTSATLQRRKSRGTRNYQSFTVHITLICSIKAWHIICGRIKLCVGYYYLSLRESFLPVLICTRYPMSLSSAWKLVLNSTLLTWHVCYWDGSKAWLPQS